MLRKWDVTPKRTGLWLAGSTTSPPFEDRTGVCAGSSQLRASISMHRTCARCGRARDPLRFAYVAGQVTPQTGLVTGAGTYVRTAPAVNRSW